MTDNVDEIELPRYARPIGVARGTVAGTWAATSTGATASGDSARSIGVLSPFAGLLNPAVEPDELPGPAPAFSYLVLRPLVVERTLERESVPVGHETTQRAEPDQARPGTAEELRVRHLLRGDPGTAHDRSGRSDRSDRSCPSEATALPVPTETDRPAADEPRAVLRPDLEDFPGSTRDLTVLDTDRSGDTESNDRAERPVAPIRDVTVLGGERLTVLERFHTRNPPATDPARAQPRARDEGSTRAERRPDGASAPADPPTLSAPPTVTTITNTTVRQSAPDRPTSRPETAELRFGAANGPTVSPTVDSPGDTPTDGDGRAPDPGRTRLAVSDRSAAEGPPPLTVTSARSGPGSDDSAASRADGDRTNGSGVRTGRPLDAGRPTERTEREGPPQRPRTETTMAALLEDTTEMNRLVDRLYREFHRKSRIERERRGL